MLTQTYRNLEIIVVDDGSGEQLEPLFTAVAQMDPRVKVVHAEVNAGAYTARNIGFAHSRGEFITVHDDDDWSHGQKIQQIIEYLMDNPEVAAATGMHVRFNADGFFTRIGKRAEFVRPSYAAIVYRRTTLELLGPWQSVRKAGDSEHLERLEKFLGEHLVVVGETPTSFSRVAPGRLTTAEVSRGYIAPDCRWYVSAYREHFDRQPGGGQDLAGMPRGVPTALRAGTFPKELDVLFCADFTQQGEQLDRLLDTAKKEVVAGRSVGFATLESPLKTKVGRVCWDVFSFLEEHEGVAVVQLNRPLNCSKVEVHGPDVLAFADGVESRVTARSGPIVVADVPEISGKPALLDLVRCEAQFRELFGPVPTWSAQERPVRDYILALGFGDLVYLDHRKNRSLPVLGCVDGQRATIELGGVQTEMGEGE